MDQFRDTCSLWTAQERQHDSKTDLGATQDFGDYSHTAYLIEPTLAIAGDEKDFASRTGQSAGPSRGQKYPTNLMPVLLDHDAGPHRHATTAGHSYIPSEMHESHDGVIPFASKVSERSLKPSCGHKLTSQYKEHTESCEGNGRDPRGKHLSPIAGSSQICEPDLGSDEETESEAEVQRHLLDFADYTRVMSDGSKKTRSQRRLQVLRVRRKRNKQARKMQLAVERALADEKQAELDYREHLSCHIM